MSTKTPKCIGCYADLRYVPFCIDGRKHPITEMTLEELEAKYIYKKQKNWFEKLKGFFNHSSQIEDNNN